MKNEGMGMQQSIMVVSSSQSERKQLCEILEGYHYLAVPLQSLIELLKAIEARACHALILDLDSLPVDNRFIRRLCIGSPEVCVIGLSSRTFHPELEEAMRSHISACLAKPVSTEELIYWLRSVCGKEPNSRDSPRDYED